MRWSFAALIPSSLLFALPAVANAETLVRVGGDPDPALLSGLAAGEPVRILDLAKQVIRLAGLRPGIDIKIDIVGARPGEKLAEETFHGGEPLVATQCKGILLASPRLADGAELARAIADLADAARRPDPDRVTAMMRALVPEYDPWRADASE
ncbi:MAG: polysaccharide biosynthesis protein [Rhodospirillales bacterium]|nr:polysaccharide biosynthesis protein [Rhodospirillales bacterium]